MVFEQNRDIGLCLCILSLMYSLYNNVNTSSSRATLYGCCWLRLVLPTYTFVWRFLPECNNPISKCNDPITKQLGICLIRLGSYFVSIYRGMHRPLLHRLPVCLGVVETAPSGAGTLSTDDALIVYHKIQKNVKFLAISQKKLLKYTDYVILILTY